jgi:ABC-type lipoprotein release transport system permease subunit
MSSHLNRHRNILDHALSSLCRRKTRNVSLLVVYTLIVFAIASLLFFTQALKREAALILDGAPDIVVQRLTAGRHDLIPVEYAAQLLSLRGVEKVTPRFWGYYFDQGIGANYTVMAAESDTPATGDLTIGHGIARLRRLQPGDMMALRAYDGQPLLLTVATIIPAAAELVAADLMVISREDFRTLFNFPAGNATDLALTVGNPAEAPTIAAKIASRFPETRPILKAEILRTYDAIFNWRGGMMVSMLGAALFAFVIFAWDKAAGLSAEERKEIGILKSIGWETGDVLLLKFWEGAAVSLTAFLCGSILAYLHVFFFGAFLFEHPLKGWAVLYPQFRLVPLVDPFQLAVLFFLVVIPYTAATIIPCWQAATIDPDAAMRS